MFGRGNESSDHSEKWRSLEEAMLKDLDTPLIFLHPNDNRNYSESEMTNFSTKETFASRLYFTSKQYGDDTSKFALENTLSILRSKLYKGIDLF